MLNVHFEIRAVQLLYQTVGFGLLFRNTWSSFNLTSFFKANTFGLVGLGSLQKVTIVNLFVYKTDLCLGLQEN